MQDLYANDKRFSGIVGNFRKILQQQNDHRKYAYSSIIEYSIIPDTVRICVTIQKPTVSY